MSLQRCASWLRNLITRLPELPVVLIGLDLQFWARIGTGFVHALACLRSQDTLKGGHRTAGRIHRITGCSLRVELEKTFNIGDGSDA